LIDPRPVRRSLAYLNQTEIIAYYDWLPLQGNLVRQTELLIEKYNPQWKGGNQFGIHPKIFRDLGEAGFSDIVSQTYDEAAQYTLAGVGELELAPVLAQQWMKKPC